MNSIFDFLLKLLNWNSSPQKIEDEELRFIYTPAIHAYSFNSCVHMDFIKTLTAANLLLKKLTEFGTGDINENILYLNWVQIYIKEIDSVDKISKRYKLVSWLHYQDSSDDEFYHYDPSYIMDYLRVVDAIESIFTDSETQYNTNRVSDLQFILDHFSNTKECIRAYIKHLNPPY